MAVLQVYCSMKDRGCGWAGTLEQLDVHLDPDLDKCLYLDIICPLICGKIVPKNMVEQHVTEECVQRDYGCQHCTFKATYKVVVDTHWPECIYMPLQCPNLCGVTCERGLIKDHISMCNLKEVACVFAGVGCKVTLRREEQEEHTTHNTQKHFAITAGAVVKMKELLHHQEDKILYLQEKILHQEEKNKHQELKIQYQEEKIEHHEEKINELEKLNELLQEQSHENGAALKEITNFINVKKSFAMENFSKEKANGSHWKSPAMYTHLCGYKYCIDIYADGYNIGCGEAVAAFLCAMPGEYDHLLKWPVRTTFTLEAINQKGGENVKDCRLLCDWGRVERTTQVKVFGHFTIEGWRQFISNSDLESFLRNDTLYFCTHCIFT